MASGDYLVPVDHDDLVPENALYEFASAIRRDDAIDMLYSDEDKVSMDGRHFLSRISNRTLTWICCAV